jgi:hypothetical protein
VKQGGAEFEVLTAMLLKILSFLVSCLRDMLLRYFLGDFELVSGARISIDFTLLLSCSDNLSGGGEGGGHSARSSNSFLSISKTLSF